MVDDLMALAGHFYSVFKSQLMRLLYLSHRRTAKIEVTAGDKCQNLMSRLF